jgi:hypothetical protein
LDAINEKGGSAMPEHIDEHDEHKQGPDEEEGRVIDEETRVTRTLEGKVVATEAAMQSTDDEEAKRPLL